MLMKSCQRALNTWKSTLIILILHGSGVLAVEAGPAGVGRADTQAGPLGPCGDVISKSCVWSTVAATPQPTKVASAWPAAAVGPPVLLVPGQPAAAEPLPGFALTLQRLTLANVSLAAPDAAGTPKLWPLGLYSASGSNLSLWDVRLLVSQEQFQQYLQYFRTAGQQYFMKPADSPWDMHTDGESFIHIPEWTDKISDLQSVTLISGPCTRHSLTAFLEPAESAATAAAAAAADPSGCNVRTVDNTTLVPTLEKDAAVVTQQPLLVLIVSNVSLGEGLRAGAINVWRPVVMVGLWTVPTSVDLFMQVNQLNVTEKNSVIYWQSLLLENAAPGDALSSTMARPYSAAVSANLWAMQCNRSRRGVGCLNLHNTTTIMASQEEMDYTTFMYSMFNSPLPNMRQHTDFYHTELNCTILDMGPGPNGNGMILSNMSCSAWKLRNGVFTTQPIVRVAKAQPFPSWGPKIRQSTQAAPWVEAVGSCTTLQAAMQSPSEETRLHVWMLLNNISIAPDGNTDCWQYRDVKYTTHIFGQVQGTDSSNSKQLQQVETSLDISQRDGVGFDVFALSLGYMRSAFQLPAGAADRFMQIQNVTLNQLVQGPNAHLANGMKAGQDGDAPTPPDIWTLLLWSFNRSMMDAQVYMSNVQLLLPQPEWEFVANTARASASFVVQLAGSVGLAFTSASVVGTSVRISSLQGPGLSGENVWLLLDPAAVSAMPGGYAWPLSVAAAPTSSRATSEAEQMQHAMIQAAVGASIGGAALLALLGLCWWWCVRRRRRQHEQQEMYATAAAYSKTSGSGSDMQRYADTSPLGIRPLQSPGPYVSIDVGHLPDNRCSPAESLLPVAVATKGSKPGSASSGHISLVQAADGSEGRSSAMAASSSVTASHSAGSGRNTVASGLQRWKTAISTTTIQLMERRMHSVHTTPPGTNSISVKTGVSLESHATGLVRTTSAGGKLPPAVAGAAPTAAWAATAIKPTNPLLQPPPSLQLQGVLGQGSFGCVYLGTWHGKRVAVKVMQLPASALLDSQEWAEQQHVQLSPEEQQRRQRKALQSNSPPHMAIMETVVSSTMSHPNVVQVYTYMLNPLTVDEVPSTTDELADNLHQVQSQQQQQRAALAAARGTVSGWELKLVMEYCDQGTLREALDRKTLIRGDGIAYLQPALLLSLAHDIAAALLHLHTEGVVHGDLKAANVLLTKGGEDEGGIWAATTGHKVTAKVADFGLALQLDPKDTHATMAARGTPTHMSPELFLSGHVSKASDVYAFGILLFEMMTGQRAYRGVPIPLLPHEVARQGLRPTWPAQLPGGYKDLKRLAEACWQQLPQDRPSLLEVFSFLEYCQAGKSPPSLRNGQHLQAVLEQHSAQRGDGSFAPSTEQQLQQTAEQQQVEQHCRNGGGSGAGQNQAAKAEMAWTEVTYAGMNARQ